MEVCKIATATLTHDQMVDLLRTSAQVNVVVIACHESGAARRYVMYMPDSITILSCFFSNQYTRLVFDVDVARTS